MVYKQKHFNKIRTSTWAANYHDWTRDSFSFYASQFLYIRKKITLL